MPRPNHFEIHSDDFARETAFYSALFGWTFVPWKGGDVEYTLVMTGPDTEPGINGGMVKRMGPSPANGQAVNAYVCTLSGITDVDATVAKAVELGGTVALPKMGVPGVGWLAYIKDPAGNILGLMQTDPNAK
jgi:predicted enzyme related to lactoylglutathione lyase